MGRSSKDGLGLAQYEAESFKISIAAVCRKMTAEQILDLADYLHDIIRARAARTMARPQTGCRPGGVTLQVEERSL